jgi:hypothetical protein
MQVRLVMCSWKRGGGKETGEEVGGVHGPRKPINTTRGLLVGPEAPEKHGQHLHNVCTWWSCPRSRHAV